MGDGVAGGAGGRCQRGQRGSRAALVGGLVVGHRQVVDGDVAGVGDQEAIRDGLADRGIGGWAGALVDGQRGARRGRDRGGVGRRGDSGVSGIGAGGAGDVGHRA